MWYIVSPAAAAKSTSRLSSGCQVYIGDTKRKLETTVLDHGRGQELLVKEALHIQMTPVEERFNRDGGLEVPVMPLPDNLLSIYAAAN